MEPVIVKHKVWAVIDIIVGGYLMFVGIGHLVIAEYPMKFMDWFGAFFNIVIGVIIIGALFSSMPQIPIKKRFCMPWLWWNRFQDETSIMWFCELLCDKK
jgi:hypothetical protein